LQQNDLLDDFFADQAIPAAARRVHGCARKDGRAQIRGKQPGSATHRVGPQAARRHHAPMITIERAYMRKG
jgi:hypothetical protein